MAVRKQTALRATNDCLKNVNQRTWAHFNLETKQCTILSHSKRIACYYFNFVIKPFRVTILVRDPGPFHTMAFLLCCTRGSNFKSVVEILADNDSIECYWTVPLYGTFIMLCVLNFSLCTGGQCYSVGSYWAVALFMMMHEVVLDFKSVDETSACRFKWKLRNKSCVVNFIMLSKFGLTSMLTNESSVLCNNQECPSHLSAIRLKYRIECKHLWRSHTHLPMCLWHVTYCARIIQGDLFPFLIHLHKGPSLSGKWRADS